MKPGLCRSREREWLFASVLVLATSMKKIVSVLCQMSSIVKCRDICRTFVGHLSHTCRDICRTFVGICRTLVGHFATFLHEVNQIGWVATQMITIDHLQHFPVLTNGQLLKQMLFREAFTTLNSEASTTEAALQSGS